MTQPVFNRLLLPVANEEDAEATYEAIQPYVEAGANKVVVLHVAETDEDEVDDASRAQAKEIFNKFRDAFSSNAITVETELRSGLDITAEIATVVEELDVTAIGVLPRSKNALVRLLSKETTTQLISSTDVPIIVLPQTPVTSVGEQLTSTDEKELSWTPKLLVPVGGSQKSLDAVEFACTAYSDPEVTALHIREPVDADIYSEMTPGVSSEIEEPDRQRRQKIESMFQQASIVADDLGVELTTMTRPGDVVSGIIQHAEEEPVDMIVVGSKDGTQPDRRRLGDISKALIRKAPVPVVLI
jgi:nucleotide-binding universal stress UspA family protein